MKRSTKHIVKNLMRSNKLYRNDDRALRLKVWESYGFYLSKSQLEKYMELPADGAITRRRREFSAMYPASPGVVEKRFKAFQDKRDYYGSFWKRLFKSV